jgi:hypothetical protein
MPSKVWVVGEEVLAPDFNTYVQQQVVAQFPTTAARGSGIASPVAGQGSYLDTGNETEGIEFWNGAAWRRPWNMPWGEVGRNSNTGQWNALGPIQDLLPAAFTSVAGRRYRVTGLIHITNGGAANQWTMQITDSANAIVQQAGYTLTASQSAVAHAFYEGAFTPGAITVKVRGGGSAAWSWAGTVTQISYITVDDIGPTVGAVPT